MAVTTRSRLRCVALAGNPNSGKTTLFNALTGLRQKVGNYPGVTVEKKEGRLLLDECARPGRGSAGRHDLCPPPHEVTLVDLPGAYSLTPRSPDEAIARDVLLGRRSDTPRPDLVITVVDASNLERNLYLVTQITDMGLPVVVVLNMVDVAERQGVRVDPAILQRGLGVPVIPTVASRSRGLAELRQAMTEATLGPVPRRWRMVPEAEEALAELTATLERTRGLAPEGATAEALELLISPDAERDTYFPAEAKDAASRVRERLASAGIDAHAAPIEARYDWISEVCHAAVSRAAVEPVTLTDRIDRVLTHRFWGAVVFVGLMALVFQAIMSWATGPMDVIDGAFAALKGVVQAHMPAGDLRDLITDGVIAGMGGVLVFLPQIAFLFLFIGLLEDSGYMARAAFMTDRVMSRVGLHGKSFIPLLSSFACAIPGILATRTIESRKDRLVTILIAPLMSCSARLPVYLLMIGAFIPARRVWGFLTLPTLTLLCMYLLGFVVALGMAALFKKTLLKAETPIFIMELPPYRLPDPKTVLFYVWSQAREFLVRAGTVILAISVCIWFLTSYPKLPGGTPGAQLAHSFAGKIGHTLEPVLRPLGFDWKIGIGLVGAMAAREVFVSTMATVYSVGTGKGDEAAASGLRAQMKRDVSPRTGRPVWTPLVAISLMVYFVLAMQCMSTIAVVRRETGGWRWPLFQIAYMTGLAYAASLLVYQGGRLLGLGA
jgi:ferrous iron transport protein B